MNFLSQKNTRTSGAKRELHIGIEHHGILLFEIYTEDYTKEIVIGRHPQCDWSLNKIDESASGKHAQISRRKGAYYLTDLGSLNGLYFQSKRISERKLLPGDRITLGECVVFVNDESKRLKNLTQLNQLSYVNANGKKVFFDISKPENSIGSSKECDLHIQDQLVSSVHAVITLRNDGSCWIKDKGSRNGTSVNGKELVEGVERMLQEGDTITIAYIEMKFLDASIIHESSRLLSSIAIVGITILVVMGIYIAWWWPRPTASAFLNAAKAEAAQLDFNLAIKHLDEARMAREADAFRKEIDDFARQIEIWKKTLNEWNSIQQDLSDEKFEIASSKLSSIKQKGVGAWVSNNKKIDEEREKAQAVKCILDCYFDADSLLKKDVLQLDEVSRQKDNLLLAMRNMKEMIKLNHYDEAPYMKVLFDKGAKFISELEKTEHDYAEFDKIIEMLKEKDPAYDDIIARLKGLEVGTQISIREKAKQIQSPVERLNIARKCLGRMADMVMNLQFPDGNLVQEILLDSNSVDYSVEKNIASLRQNLLQRATQLDYFATQLDNLYKDLNEKGIICGKNVEAIDVFLNDGNLKKMYSFDVFNGSLPRGDRRMPQGMYDKLVGYEFMYDYLENVNYDSQKKIDTGMMTVNVSDLTFEPQLYVAKRRFNDVSSFLEFVYRDENLWLHKGKLGEFINHCEKIPVSYFKVVQKCLEMADKYRDVDGKKQITENSKCRVLALGIANYLLKGVDEKSISTKNLPAELLTLFPKVRESLIDLSEEYSKLRSEVTGLNRKYGVSSPEEQIKIREKILSIGFPGDSSVKKMWLQRLSVERSK